MVLRLFLTSAARKRGGGKREDASKCRERKKRWPLAVKGAQDGAKVKVVPGRAGCL